MWNMEAIQVNELNFRIEDKAINKRKEIFYN